MNSAPFGCLRVAREYFDAAGQVQQPARSELDVLRQRVCFPAYFLVGHAIELALKAFLLGRGMTVEVLKRRPYQHSLTNILSEARRRKLGQVVKLSKTEVFAVQTLDSCYSAKEFEYAATGLRRLPHYAVVYDTADRLIGGLHPYCWRLASNPSLKRSANSGPRSRGASSSLPRGPLSAPA